MLPVVRDVRVTSRNPVTMPFVPSDLSPVQSHLKIDDAGLKGWTDKSRKVTVVNRLGSHLPVGHSKRELASKQVGDTVIRSSKVSSKVRIRSRYLNTGPSASYRAEKLAASKRA